MEEIKVLRQYVEGEMNVTEYTSDGKTISHIVKEAIPTPVPEGESNISSLPETIEEKVEKANQQSLASLDITLGIYEEILALKEELYKT